MTVPDPQDRPRNILEWGAITTDWCAACREARECVSIDIMGQKPNARVCLACLKSACAKFGNGGEE